MRRTVDKLSHSPSRDGSAIESRSGRYRTLLRYALRVWPTLVLIAAVTFAASALTMLEPWPMKVLVDNVLSSKPVEGAVAGVLEFLPGAGDRAGLLIWVAVAGLIFFALGSVVDVLLSDSWVRAGIGMTYGLGADLFARLQRRSTVFHTKTTVGDSMTRVLTDSWCVTAIIDALVFKPVYAVATSVGIVLVMMRMNSRLTWIALMVVPFMAIASLLARRRIRSASRQKRMAGVKISAHVQQALSGVSVVQAFAQEFEERKRFSDLAADSIRADQRATVVSEMNRLASGFVTTAGIGIVLWLGSRDVMAGTLTLGGLLVFLAYLKTLQGKFTSIAGAYASLQSVDASVERVIETLARPDVVESPDPRRIQRAEGNVRVENVTFGYDEGRPVLRNVTIEARPGETTAIAGPTGAGKSTLVSLIPRFFDPWSGRVLLDGVDVRELRLRDLRRQVAWVPQETFLFPASVAENIAFGRAHARRSEIVTAARNAKADSFIEQLPNGYDTILGERGMTLSGGERQRLAIARAMLVDAPILILDEPTSAVDAETDEALQAAIRRLGEGRTVIVIAHRLSTIRTADHVIVLENGTVAEDGNHETLAAGDGLFARLSRWQGDEAPTIEDALALAPGGAR